MNLLSKSFGITLCVTMLATATFDAHADRPTGGHARSAHSTVLDHRYGHDRYYPPRGHIVRELPPGHQVSRWRGSPYYFHGGAWYRPARSGWIVVAPPVGLVVPILPPYYTTVWVGGAPYYYANDVYYAWRPAQRSYVVVERPTENASVDTQAARDDLYVYPKNGQSAEQQASDRYECHRWAINETGFDPTQPLGGVASEQAPEKRTAYFRAMTACLEGRGYSVK